MSEKRTFTGSEARNLLRRARTGTLATLNRDDGIPYGSLVNVATDVEGQPILLVSRLAWHTRNLLADSRASIVVAEPPADGDALTGPRVTIMGRLAPAGSPRVRRRYLARHPQAQMYADFGDFEFWRLLPERAHAVAGFGRIETLEADEVFPSCPEMLEIEESAVGHMNEDHAGAVRLIATRLLSGEDRVWKVNAIDPDGADLGDGSSSLRMAFPHPVWSADALRGCLAQLAGQAREMT